jgi:hypothetical protein
MKSRAVERNWQTSRLPMSICICIGGFVPKYDFAEFLILCFRIVWFQSKEGYGIKGGMYASSVRLKCYSILEHSTCFWRVFCYYRYYSPVLQCRYLDRCLTCISINVESTHAVYIYTVLWQSKKHTKWPIWSDSEFRLQHVKDRLRVTTCNICDLNEWRSSSNWQTMHLHSIKFQIGPVHKSEIMKS